jgi:hypothetical protein
VYEAVSQYAVKVWGNFMQELSTLFGDHTVEFEWLHNYEEVGGIGRHTKNLGNLGGQDDGEERGATGRSRADMDFGPDKAWELLYAPPPAPGASASTHTSPVCISKKIEKYNYELCFFDSVKQDGKTLGRFDSWKYISEADSAEMLANSVVQETGYDWLMKAKASLNADAKRPDKHGYNMQVYDNGDRCFSSGRTIPRSVNVYYYCSTAKQGEIMAVRETEMCKYDMLVSTAFACQDKMEKKSLQLLDDLGVFGFNRKGAKK